MTPTNESIGRRIAAIITDAINTHCPGGKWVTGPATLHMAISCDIEDLVRELDRQAPGEWGGYEAFEQFLAAEIDSAPEALRRLGKWLGNVLDEDHFATANRLVLGAMLETSDAIRKVAASKAAPQPAAQGQGECVRHECRRVRIEMQAEIDRLRAAGAEDAREAEVFKEGWEYGYWHGQQTPNGYSNPSDCQADWHEYKQQREAAIASRAQEGE